MTHPTIRAISGATSAKSIDPKSTALLVIDFQNEYFTGKLPIPNGNTALANAKRLIDMADGLGIPVFHIQHVTPAGAPIFAEDGQKMGRRWPFMSIFNPQPIMWWCVNLQSACFPRQISTRS